MAISVGREPLGRSWAPMLATLAALAGLGYVCWRVLDLVQSWAAASPLAAQFIQ